MLDYSVKDFDFLVGGVDFSPYLTSLSVSSGNSDITTPLVWRGDFEIVRTQNCPLTDNDFSEFATPARWRRGVAQIQLNFFGLPALRLRIDSYRYYNGKGSGKLTQVLDLVEFDRPSEEIGDFSYGGQRVGTAIAALLTHAIGGTGTSFDLGAFLPDAALDGELTTRTPIADAQKLCGVYWQWLYTDVNGVIRVNSRQGSPMPLFVRPSGQFEAVPDEDAIHFAAEKLIVAGSHEIAKPYETTEEDEVEAIALIKAEIKKAEVKFKFIAAAAKKAKAAVEKLIDEQPLYEEQVVAENLDEAGRSLRTEIKTQKPAALLFPGSSTAGSGLVTAQKKRIYNFYEDGGENFTTQDLPSFLRADVALCKPVSGFGNGTGLYCTVIIVQEPLGVVFPQRAPSSGLITSSITIEGILFKKQYQPTGVVIPSFGVSTGLIVSSKEVIESGLPLVGIGAAIASIATQEKEVEDAEVKLEALKADLVAAKVKFTSPKTGITARYERPVEPEEKVESPEVELITESFKGVALIQSIGWNPFVAKVQVENVGFLPSQGTANSLASRIAFREIARRDGLIVEMPLPIEWVAAGCPPFATAYLDTDAVMIDAPIIEMKGTTLVFSFTGERLGSVPKVLNTTPLISPITPVAIEVLERQAAIVRSLQLIELEPTIATIEREARLVQLSILSLPTVERSVELIEVPLFMSTVVRSMAFIEQPPPEILLADAIVRAGSILEVDILGNYSAVRAAELIETATGTIAGTARSHWTLNTTDWLDAIGGRTLTKIGSVISVAGRVGNAAEFGGGSTFSNTLSNTSDVFRHNAPWVLSLKFQRNASFNGGRVRRHDPNTGEVEWELSIIGGVISLRVFASSISSDVVFASNEVTDTRWQIVFAEVTASQLKLTVDGVTNTTPLTVTPFVIGAGAGEFQISGRRCKFDDVYFYN